MTYEWFKVDGLDTFSTTKTCHYCYTVAVMNVCEEGNKEKKP